MNMWQKLLQSHRSRKCSDSETVLLGPDVTLIKNPAGPGSPRDPDLGNVLVLPTRQRPPGRWRRPGRGRSGWTKTDVSE